MPAKEGLSEIPFIKVSFIRSKKKDFLLATCTCIAKGSSYTAPSFPLEGIR